MPKHFYIVAILLISLLVNTSGIGQTRSGLVDERNVRAQMNFLAGDAMQGRGSGTIFERIAAEYIGSQFMQFGLEPAGDAGADGKPTFVQSVPAMGPRGRQTWNAIGKITGTRREAEVILLSAHLDHVGVNPDEPGDDKIFNGADDDASGTVAVLELARVLAKGKKPRRTIYFVCFGSEELGGFGARYFVQNLPFPKEKLIANLAFEMIGRPDEKVKPGELWLTGYERSDLGSTLARRGARIVADPHPQENFFQRSDNYTLARQGIIAHTVSSYGLHRDYHKPSDEPAAIDLPHMTRSIASMIAPVRWLANSNFKPVWHPGKKP